MNVLPVQASSVSSERAFSSAKLTCTRERNNISAEHMEYLQVLKHSLHRRQSNHNNSQTLDFMAHIVNPAGEDVNKEMATPAHGSPSLSSSSTIWLTISPVLSLTSISSACSLAYDHGLGGDGSFGGGFGRGIPEMKLEGITPEFAQAVGYESFTAFSEYFNRLDLKNWSVRRDKKWLHTNIPMGNGFAYLKDVSQEENGMNEQGM
ncbi:unnamed protein product [Rhizoctonia solani]|uniref:HAT C-terminal dimerisation domain-containing protein n=1 Tax=Rhizoctonia solani TaxID=456999 RepID=A0A8H3BX65_9AGAM|nr:unnamed protein product [Rhizoctonia solani]